MLSARKILRDAINVEMEKTGERMKRICRIIVLVAACLTGGLGQEATAGVWVGGKVTKAPWHEQGYLYIGIDNVRYTIMPDVKVEFAYTANNATTKKPITVSSLHVGDSLVAMAEGNRIYQIEKGH